MRRPPTGKSLIEYLNIQELKKEKVGHFPQSIPKDLMNVISTESWHCLSLDVEFSFWIRRNGEPVEPAAKMVQKCTRNNNRECIYRDVIARREN